MKRYLGMSLLAVAIAAFVSPTFGQMHHGNQKPAAAESSAELPLCPIMGEPVDFSQKTDTPDGPVYFCCKSCIKKYKKNPAKYAAKVAAQRAALRKLPQVQVACPLTGKPINRDMYTMVDGKKVYFCCAGCKGKFEASPKKYAKKLAASYTYQTRCPVTSEEIDPGTFLDLPGGKRVYFCCKGCEAKLLKNPAKYAKKLADQGTIIDPDKIKSAGKGGLHKRRHGGHEHP